MSTTLAQFVLDNVARSVVLKPTTQGLVSFNLTGSSPKVSARAIRRKLAKLERRAAEKGGKK